MVVQQDREAADYIRHGLMQAGHVVDSLRNGLDALVHGTSSSFDLVIVDRELPDLDGVSLVRGLRAAGLSIPVLFVAAGNVQDRVEGLQAGGDDYLVKPFSFLELLARVTALGRRPPQRVEQVVLHIADLPSGRNQHSSVAEGDQVAGIHDAQQRASAATKPAA